MKKFLLFVVVVFLLAFLTAKYFDKKDDETSLTPVLDNYDKARAETMKINARTFLQYFELYKDKEDNTCYEIDSELAAKLGITLFNNKGSIYYTKNETYIWLSDGLYQAEGTKNNITVNKTKDVVTNCNR